MATASFLIADIQTKLGDPSGNIFTSATLLGWLNEATKDFCMKGTPLRQVDATTISTGTFTFAMPSDRIMIEGIFSRNQIPVKLKALTPTEFGNQQAACPGAVGKDSSVWTEMDQKIYLHPAYGTRAAVSLLTTFLSSSGTTVNILDTSDFKEWGRIRIDSEEIEYSSKDDRNLYGCTRGVAGTTATSHNNKGGTLVYQCDLWIVYRRAPTPMTAVTSSPDIPVIYHEKLEEYVMYLAYFQAGEKDKAKDMWKRWTQTVKEAQYSCSKETLTPIEVRDSVTQQANSLYGPR